MPGTGLTKNGERMTGHPFWAQSGDREEREGAKAVTEHSSTTPDELFHLSES